MFLAPDSQFHPGSPALGFPCPRRLQNRTNHTNRTDCPDRAERADLADLVAFPSTGEEETGAGAEARKGPKGKKDQKGQKARRNARGCQGTGQEQWECVQQRQKRQGEQKGAGQEPCWSSPARHAVWSGRGLRESRKTEQVTRPECGAALRGSRQHSGAARADFGQSLGTGRGNGPDPSGPL